MKIKTILKCLAWIAAMLLVAVAIVYGFWLILIFMLFSYTFYMWLAIVGELILFAVYFWLVRLAEC